MFNFKKKKSKNFKRRVSVEKFLKENLYKKYSKDKSDNFSSLDNKVAAKLDSIGENDLAKKLIEKNITEDTVEPVKIEKGSFVKNILSNRMALSFVSLSTIIFIGVGYLFYVGYFDQFFKKSKSITELAMYTQPPEIYANPVDIIDKGYVSQTTPVILKLETPIKGSPDSNISVSPDIEYTLESEISDSEQIITITPKQDIPRGENYRVSINEGTVFEDGSKLYKDMDWIYFVEPIFNLTGTTPRDNLSEVPIDTAFEFNFTHSGINVDKFKENFSISPKTDGQFEKIDSTIIFVPKNPLAPSAEYTIKISKEFSNEAGETLPEDQIINFKTSLYYSDNKISEVPRLIWGDYKSFITSTDRVYIDLLAIGANDKFFNSKKEAKFNLYSVEEDKLVQKYVNSNGTINSLPDGAKKIDSQVKTFKRELFYDYKPDKAGIYILKASVDGTAAPIYRVISYSNIGTLLLSHTSSNGDTEGWTFDMNKGVPIANVDIKTYKIASNGGSINPHDEGTSNSQGYYKIKSGDLYIAQKGSSYSIISQYDDYYQGMVMGRARSTDYATKLIIDKPFYSPGDKVNFSGVIRELENNDLQMPANSTVEFKVVGEPQKYSDYNGVKELTYIYQSEYKLSAEYGTFGGEFKIPHNFSGEGLSISFYIDGKYIGGDYVQVMKYKKMSKVFSTKTDKVEYFSGDTVTVDISGEDYSGLPLSGEEVQVKIYKSKYDLEYRDDNPSSYKNYLYPGSNLIKESSVKLNSEGKYQYKFTPTTGKDKNYYDVYYVEVSSKTDGNSNNDSSLFIVSHLKRAVRTKGENYYNVNIGESVNLDFVSEKIWSGDLTPNQDFESSIVRSYYVEEGESYYDPYLKENRFVSTGRMEKENIVENKKLSTNEKGIANYELKNLKEGSYDLLIKCNGREALYGSKVYVSDFKDFLEPLMLIPEKRNYDVGDEAKYTAISSYDREALFVVSAGEVLHTQIVDMKKNKKVTLKHEITEEMYPYYEVGLYTVVDAKDIVDEDFVKYKRAGNLFAQSSPWDGIINVNSEKMRIDTNLDLSKNVYFPGEEVEFTIST
ncbi:MAG TPA: hypothetical protein ENN64_01265, partial [bacterium]|nr:hypothetical protein [bacterium]